jgi:hypothetical protein
MTALPIERLIGEFLPQCFCPGAAASNDGSGVGISQYQMVVGDCSVTEKAMASWAENPNDNTDFSLLEREARSLLKEALLA